MDESVERTDQRLCTYTNVESIKSRQKKGKMKSIFLSDSDKEAIVEFVEQHEELYNKILEKFKDKQREEYLWERLTATGIYLSPLPRSSSRPKIPDMASSFTRSEAYCSEVH